MSVQTWVSIRVQKHRCRRVSNSSDTDDRVWHDCPLNPHSSACRSALVPWGRVSNTRPLTKLGTFPQGPFRPGLHGIGYAWGHLVHVEVAPRTLNRSRTVSIPYLSRSGVLEPMRRAMSRLATKTMSSYPGQGTRNLACAGDRKRRSPFAIGWQSGLTPA
jgi:hypothetical protein